MLSWFDFEYTNTQQTHSNIYGFDVMTLVRVLFNVIELDEFVVALSLGLSLSPWAFPLYLAFLCLGGFLSGFYLVFWTSNLLVRTSFDGFGLKQFDFDDLKIWVLIYGAFG